MLKIKNAYKDFFINNKKIHVLADINLTVKQGEFIAIIGHSGCGKSTLLRIIAGLNTFDSGNLLFKNKAITKPNTNIGIIFQDHRLLPWLTIEKNISLGLDFMPKKEKQKLVRQYLNLVNLQDFAKAYPKQLSGGMSQRAAARALVTYPQLLLLDEPLSSLDALTKIELQKEIINIKNEKNITMILITHDIEEAIYLANKVVVMSVKPGKFKKIINIDLPYPRNRNSLAFNNYKKLIFQEFFDNQSDINLLDYEI